jgi:DNA-binding XRE family transcriptional regulator
MINKELLVEANSFFDKEDDVFRREIEVELLLVDIASEFIKYRVAKDISQKELAKILGITQAMVSKLESGDYNPTIKFLFEICQKLDWDFNVNINSHTEKSGYNYMTQTNEFDSYAYNCIGLAS